jgi:hypothetical protein
MRIGASCARLRARLGSSMEYDATLVPVTTQEHQSPRDIHHNRQREDSRPSCIGVVVACVHRGGGGVNTTRSYDELSGAACRREPVPSKPFWQAGSQPARQPARRTRTVGIEDPAGSHPGQDACKVAHRVSNPCTDRPAPIQIVSPPSHHIIRYPLAATAAARTTTALRRTQQDPCVVGGGVNVGGPVARIAQSQHSDCHLPRDIGISA